MSKAVLMSIQPKWCELIANGKKTVEVRKTKPKLKTPFKVYIYCTKAREFFSYGGVLCAANDELYRLPTGEIKFGDSIELMCCYEDEYSKDNFLNGKVIGEFVCNEISEHHWLSYRGDYGVDKDFLLKACLSYADMRDYGNEKNLYSWHISDLVIYDKPKELSEFYKEDFEEVLSNWEDYIIKRPPQSWCYVEEWSDTK